MNISPSGVHSGGLCLRRPLPSQELTGVGGLSALSDNEFLLITRVTRSCQFRPGAGPKRPIRLRQHGTPFILVSQKFTLCIFVKQDRVSSSLPEAEMPFRSGTA
jgi:hypothetical protein